MLSQAHWNIMKAVAFYSGLLAIAVSAVIYNFSDDWNLKSDLEAAMWGGAGVAAAAFVAHLLTPKRAGRQARQESD